MIIAVSSGKTTKNVPKHIVSLGAGVRAIMMIMAAPGAVDQKHVGKLIGFLDH